MAANTRYILAGLAAAAGIAAIFHPPAARPALTIQTAPPSAPSLRKKLRASKTLLVYVAGAVKHAGLYRVPEGARAFEAVSKAGGFRGDADPAGVDLAEPLFDGEEIAAPLSGSRRTAARGIRRAARAKRARKSKPAQDAPVDLNAAGVATLSQLPGIGEEMAQRLVRYRETNGAFASLDELADVAGMTARRIDAVTPYLSVNP